MKKTTFQTAVCKLIAANKVKSVTVRELLLRLAVSGTCRPCLQRSRAYLDKTEEVIEILRNIGIPESKHSRKGNYVHPGYYVANDAPRGGKLGTEIIINFDLFD